MDEFSTPLDKLPSLHPVSTREEGGNPTTDSLSYEDLIRDQQSMPQQTTQPMQPMPQQPMPQQPMPQQPQQPQHPQHPQYPMQMQYHGGDYSDYDDEYDPRPRPRRGSRTESNVTNVSNVTNASNASNAETSWVVARLKMHKNDILATALTLALLTVVIPRMRTMTRFENGIPLVAMIGISIAFASVLNTVTRL